MRSFPYVVALSVAVATAAEAFDGSSLFRRAPPSDLKLDSNGYEISTGHIDANTWNHHVDFHKFVTRPDIDAPRFDVKIYDAATLAPGYWFLAPYEDKDQARAGGPWVGPAIYDGQGELVWGAPGSLFEGWDVFDFRPTTVGGKSMLSLIWRHVEAMVLDETYRKFKGINLSVSGEGWELNMHDFNLKEDGKRALLLKTKQDYAFQEFEYGGGFSGDCLMRHYGFEEIDTATSQVVFDWSSEGLIDLEETFNKRAKAGKVCRESKKAYDYVHANSIDKFPDGDYLLNSRNCNAMFKISHKDGSIVWRFGGMRSDFEFNADPFQGQHDTRVRFQNDTHVIISFLDNAYLPFTEHKFLGDASRGLVVALRTDTKPMTAEILERYDHPHTEYALGRGSYQILPNGNTFIGWTAKALHSEYATDGRMIMEAVLRAKLKSYRSYKGEWVGRPVEPPDAYAETKSANGGKDFLTAMWASWNGATEVSEWRFYSTAPDGSSKQYLGSAKRKGFETVMVYAAYASHIVAEAVDSNGNVLGQSEVVKTVVPAEHAFDNGEVEKTQSWLVNWTAEATAVAVINQRYGASTVVLFFIGFGCSLLISCAGWLGFGAWRERWSGRERWSRRRGYTHLPEDASEGEGGDSGFLMSDDKT